MNDADYQVPFKFTGKLTKLTLTIDRPKLTPEDEKKLMQATREQQGKRVAWVGGKNGREVPQRSHHGHRISLDTCTQPLFIPRQKG